MELACIYIYIEIFLGRYICCFHKLYALKQSLKKVYRSKYLFGRFVIQLSGRNVPHFWTGSIEIVKGMINVKCTYVWHIFLCSFVHSLQSYVTFGHMRECFKVCGLFVIPNLGHFWCMRDVKNYSIVKSNLAASETLCYIRNQQTTHHLSLEMYC